MGGHQDKEPLFGMHPDDSKCSKNYSGGPHFIVQQEDHGEEGSVKDKVSLMVEQLAKVKWNV